MLSSTFLVTCLKIALGQKPSDMAVISSGSMGTARERIKCQANGKGIRIVAIPQIGTAYGGLSRKKVHTIIEQVFDDWSGTLYVYEKYIAGQSG